MTLEVQFSFTRLIIITTPNVCYLSNVTFNQAVFLSIVHVVDGWESNKNSKTLDVSLFLGIFRSRYFSRVDLSLLPV